MNHSRCMSCRKLVPAHQVVREGKVFLVKECPDCGPTEALVSRSAERHLQKQSLDTGWQKQPLCKDIRCDVCSGHREPSYAFVDVTNRCNMTCKMCVDSVPGQGFVYDPPMEYFDKIFEHLASFERKPTVCFFGGEPTVRKDLTEIIDLARGKYGLRSRVLTNALKLADMDYLKELAATRTHLLVSYDGNSVEQYEQLRGSSKYYDLKREAVENISKLEKARISYVTCLAWGLNDDQLPELFDFFHSQRRTVQGVFLMPLMSTWKQEEFDYMPQRMTNECVEMMVAECFPGYDCEFVSLGLVSDFPHLMEFLGVDPMPYAGASPNCESLYVLVSDGEKFVPIEHYLRGGLPDVGRELIKIEKRVKADNAAAQTSPIARALSAVGLYKPLTRLRTTAAMGWLAARYVRFPLFFKGKGLGKLGHAAAFFTGTLLGRKSRDLRRKHLNAQEVFSVVVLPLEDDANIETERLTRCPCAHITYHPDTETFNYISVCSWRYFNRDALKGVMESYERIGQPIGKLTASNVAEDAATEDTEPATADAE